MAEDRLVKLIRKGANAWNSWRHAEIDRFYKSARLNKHNTLDLPDHEIDLSSANLRGLKLEGLDLSLTVLRRVDFRRTTLNDVDFSNSDLRGARFREAKLISPQFIETDLAGADFTSASIVDAEFSDADLTGANFASATIDIARFGGSILKGTDFTGAYLGATEFAPRDFSGATLKAGLDSCVFLNADLSGVKGLAYAHHLGPSTIGIDTFYRSKGKIPKKFLLGAGIPARFVHGSSSLLRIVGLYYSCFISHSSTDKDFCGLLHSSLRRLGIPVWYFPKHAKWGREVWGEIDRGIHTCDKLLLVCSKSSLRSAPVLREIDRVLQREEKEKRDILFPIRLDNYVFTGWESSRKADVIAKTIGDFRRWRTRAEYRKSFHRLLTDLEAENRFRTP
jgi:uncharacterized protein YjbI with pentapeptide repeats